MYCVYLTSYRGNQLPPFYIGTTSLKNIDKGYLGSVSSKKYKNIWKEEIKNHRELFTNTIVAVYSTQQEAFAREQFFQRSLNVLENSLYINCVIGHKDFRNTKHSEETKLKIKLALTNNPKIQSRKRKPHSDETKRKIQLALKAHVRTTDHCLKLSIAIKGRKLSSEWRANLSKSHKGRISPNKGKKLTAEWKAKLSTALSGDRNPRYGKKHSQEAKEKIRYARLNKCGTKRTDETKTKMREAWIRRKQKAAKIEMN